MIVPIIGRCPTEKELMPHHINKCKHGIVVSQCRCMSKDKTVILVRCPPHCDGFEEFTKKRLAAEKDYEANRGREEHTA